MKESNVLNVFALCNNNMEVFALCNNNLEVFALCNNANNFRQKPIFIPRTDYRLQVEGLMGAVF